MSTLVSRSSTEGITIRTETPGMVALEAQEEEQATQASQPLRSCKMITELFELKNYNSTQFFKLSICISQLSTLIPSCYALFRYLSRYLTLLLMSDLWYLLATASETSIAVLWKSCSVWLSSGYSHNLFLKTDFIRAHRDSTELNSHD